MFAFRFMEHWNFPNCIGAIDGKHIHIQKPANGGGLHTGATRVFTQSTSWQYVTAGIDS